MKRNPKPNNPYQGPYDPMKRLGKPRKKRKGTVHTFAKVFKDARVTLEERAGQGPKDPMKNWDESWVEYRKRCRVENREAILNQLCPSRICPLCDETKPKSRQLVVLNRAACIVLEPHKVVCRSCYKKHYVNRSKNKGGRPKK